MHDGIRVLNDKSGNDWRRTILGCFVGQTFTAAADGLVVVAPLACRVISPLFIRTPCYPLCVTIELKLLELLILNIVNRLEVAVPAVHHDVGARQP